MDIKAYRLTAISWIKYHFHDRFLYYYLDLLFIFLLFIFRFRFTSRFIIYRFKLLQIGVEDKTFNFTWIFLANHTFLVPISSSYSEVKVLENGISQKIIFYLSNFM